MTRLLLSEEAEVDALTAFRFYEERREGLNAKESVLDERLRSRFRHVARHPLG